MWTIVMMRQQHPDVGTTSWFQDPQRGFQAEATASLPSLYSSHKSCLSDSQLCQVSPSLRAFLNATPSAQKHSEPLQIHSHPVCHVCSIAKLSRSSGESISNSNGFLCHPYPVSSRIHSTLNYLLDARLSVYPENVPLSSLFLDYLQFFVCPLFFSCINPIWDLC